jgi:hypothetical protein
LSATHTFFPLTKAPVISLGISARIVDTRIIQMYMLQRISVISMPVVAIGQAFRQLEKR